MPTDEVLLHRYSQAGDPAAFRGLVDRYAGLVYRTSLRITGDRHSAEDICQDCFLELACKGRSVRENVAGWLHAVATSRSLNLVRSQQRRARREQARAGGTHQTSEWSDLQPLIDRALNGLSDDLRLPIIMHYLQGESQQQVAEQLGINQATVSRRLERGVELLRKRMRSFGVMTTVAAVTSLFCQESAQAASTSLTSSLAKIGVGGFGVTFAKSTLSGLTSSLTMLGAVVGYLLLLFLVQGWLFLLIVLIGFAFLLRPPAWVRELLRAQAFGRDVVAHPMYPFRRWIWTIPPHDWKERLFIWSFVGFAFGMAAFSNLSRIRWVPGIVAALGSMALLFVTLVVRLAWRVWTHREHLPEAASRKADETSRWTWWENFLGSAVGFLVAAAWLWSLPRDERFSFSTTSVLVRTWLAACTLMAGWTLFERWRHGGVASISNSTSGGGTAGAKPVARRYHLALIAGLVLMVVVFLSSALARFIIPERPPKAEPIVHRYTSEGQRVRVETPEAFKPAPPIKGLPSQLIVAAGMGLIFSLMLLRRVIKLQDRLPRAIGLPLLSFGIVSVGLGACLTAIGPRSPDSGLRSPVAGVDASISQPQEPNFQPSPSQRELIRKYERETAVITLPDEQLPEGWYLHRYDNGMPVSIPDEELHREYATSLGLADVPELQNVAATFTRLYLNPFPQNANDVVCSVHAFCCHSELDAKQLNAAWDNRGLCVERLAIFVYGPTGLRAPSLTDRPPVPALYQHIQRSQPTSGTQD